MTMLVTVADNASIPVGQGYRVRAEMAQSDPNIIINITSITRISMGDGPHILTP